MGSGGAARRFQGEREGRIGDGRLEGKELTDGPHLSAREREREGEGVGWLGRLGRK